MKREKVEVDKLQVKKYYFSIDKRTGNNLMMV